jgi:hypothetical protein
MKTAIYQQSSGKLWDHKGDLITTGYSGAPSAVNDGSKQAIKSLGPIPTGTWTIGEAYDSKRVGPLAIPLYPMHDAFGRTYFRIHGDNISMDRTASKGCIIVSRDVRVYLVGYKQLVVIS